MDFNNSDYNEISFSAACEKFDYLINKSIDRHLISDVPLAVLFLEESSSLVTKLSASRNKKLLALLLILMINFLRKVKFKWKNLMKI